MLPIAQETLLREMDTIKAVVDKWHEKVAEGIPGVSYPISGNTPMGERLDQWLIELIGEMQFISGKTANLASILAEISID